VRDRTKKKGNTNLDEPCRGHPSSALTTDNFQRTADEIVHSD